MDGWVHELDEGGCGWWYVVLPCFAFMFPRLNVDETPSSWLLVGSAAVCESRRVACRFLPGRSMSGPPSNSARSFGYCQGGWGGLRTAGQGNLLPGNCSVGVRRSAPCV